MQDITFKLDELAERAGVSARTVRYYVQRGLLPAPQFRGRDTAYGAEHLVRLRAIRALQKRFLPLDEIESELARAPFAELERIADGEATQTAPEAPRVPAAPPPAQPVTQSQDTAAAPRWERIELAPGLELHVSDRADATTRARAVELLDAATRLGLNGGAKR